MSAKRDKLIDEAQKLVLRGQFDKAAKTYEQVLAIDPNNIGQRQKMAEVLIKAGRRDDARSELEKVGKHFSHNGFYLKAIAVHKQVQKLFPDDISITICLADLNQKHGLTANALAEYKQVYDYYEKTSNTPEALKILDRMQEVDPQNVNIRLKLAEAYFQAGKLDDAYIRFSKLATLLQERGDAAAFSKLNSRIQQLFPEKSGFMLEVLAEQVKGSGAAAAVSGLQAMLRVNPNDKRVWDLIVQAYRKLKQPQPLKMVYQHFLKFFPSEASPKVGLILIAAQEKDLKGALSLLDRYEQEIFDAGVNSDLEQLYTDLVELDPINIRLVEGLNRIYQASGKHAESQALAPKIASLKGFSNPLYDAEPLPSELDFFQPGEPDAFRKPELLIEEELEANPLVGIDATPPPETSAVAAASLDEEFEIDIDIDDLSFGDTVAETAPLTPLGEDWLDSVGVLFDSIATAPRGVRFGGSIEGVDTQSHYDLGVAFKEMGLFDEAINEFRQASTDPSRRVKCLILQGACLRERGELETAQNVLGTLLKPGLGLEDTCAAKYELALTFDVAGDKEKAAELFREIDTAHPGFRDVSSRLDAANDDESLDFSDEELMGFDLK